MSFGSPTPIEVAVQGVSLADDYAYAQKIQAQMARLAFLRDLQFAQENGYPTLDIAIDRERAGQFGLTMADVARSVVPATSSSRFTDPNYWRDPNTGNAFQIQVEFPQNRMQSVEQVGDLPVMRDGSPQPRLADIASLKPGTMPGLIERYNGQHVVSLTANIHGLTLGEAARQIDSALAAAGAPPRGVTVRMRGEIPPLEQTLSGLRIGPAAGGAGDLSAAGGQFPIRAPGAGHRADHSRGAVRRAAVCCSRPAPRSTCNRSWARSWRWGSRWPTRFCW